MSALGYWGGLEIKNIWIHEDYRKRGIGTEFLLHSEQETKRKGAIKSILDTFDFQAKDFYLKNEYSVFGELKGFPANHNRYYLHKN